jgi:hypothetical protein
MALFVPYLVLVFPVETTRDRLLFGPADQSVHEALATVADQPRQNK